MPAPGRPCREGGQSVVENDHQQAAIPDGGDDPIPIW
jgi:hypothetical protein